MTPYAFASLLAVIFLLVDVANSQLYENDRCYILGSGQQGVCKFPRDCPWATQQLRLTGVRPTNCGFSGDSVIVCCTDNGGNANNQGNSNNNQNGGSGNSRNPGSQFGNNINFGARPSTTNNNPINFNTNRGTSSNNNGNSGNTANSATTGDFLSSADINNRRGGSKSISERSREMT